VTKHPHYDVIVAWAEGEQIEYFNTLEQQWRCTDDPDFYPRVQYRIKPRESKEWEQRLLYEYESGGTVECWCNQKLISSWNISNCDVNSKALLIYSLKQSEAEETWRIKVEKT